MINELAEEGVAGGNGGVFVSPVLAIDRFPRVHLNHRLRQSPEGGRWHTVGGRQAFEHLAVSAKGDARNGARGEATIIVAVLSHRADWNGCLSHESSIAFSSHRR